MFHPSGASAPRPQRSALVVVALLLALSISAALLGGSTGSTAAAAPASVAAPAHLAEAPPDLSFVPGAASSADIDRVERIARTTYTELLDDWAGVFGDPTTVTVRLVRPGDPVTYSRCADEPVNAPLTAFFCPQESTIWLNDLLLVGFAARFGDFAVATVVAHEYAHALQLRAGVLDLGLPILDLELHADCLAGLFAHTEESAGRLTGADPAAARAGLQAVGDTNLDRPDHHGTPAQRVAAWNRGFSGQSCPVDGLAA